MSLATACAVRSVTWLGAGLCGHKLKSTIILWLFFAYSPFWLPWHEKPFLPRSFHQQAFVSEPVSMNQKSKYSALQIANVRCFTPVNRKDTKTPKMFSRRKIKITLCLIIINSKNYNSSCITNNTSSIILVVGVFQPILNMHFSLLITSPSYSIWKTVSSDSLLLSHRNYLRTPFYCLQTIYIQISPFEKHWN